MKWVRDPDSLNNRVVKRVWQVKVHELGVIRLERPSLVWNVALGLTAGKRSIVLGLVGWAIASLQLLFPAPLNHAGLGVCCGNKLP